MNDVLRLSLATLRHQSRQYLAPGLAVVLGVAFVAATLALTDSLTSSMRSAVAGQYAPYSSVVVPGGHSLPADLSEQIAELDGVTDVDPLRTGPALVAGGGGESFVFITTESGVAPHPMITGKLPQSPTEIAISESLAAGRRLGVGDAMRVTGLASPENVTTEATVVGIVDVANDPRYTGGMPAVFATPAGVTGFTGETGWQEISVIGSANEEAVSASLRSALEAKGADAIVRTATSHADEKVTEFTGGTDFLGVFLLAFAAIALFVSAIVIANTFSILLARRARETALLRAVGSTRRQVVQSALGESLVIGVVFCAIGVVVGIGVAWVLARIGWALAGDSMPDLVFTVPATAVIIPVITGIIVVLVSAVRPVLRSSRVAPLAALRPDAALTVRSRSGRWRVAIGFALCALGAVAVVAGAQLPSVFIGVAGGLVSFTGVLLVGTVLVPWAVRAIGVVAARPFGGAGRLAVDNAVRNPGRAAATASALLVGVTLVTMTAVGAATARSTVTEYINTQYPVDVVIQGATIADASVSAIEGLEGITAGAELDGTAATVRVGDTSSDTVVAALPAGIADVVRSADVVPEVTEGSVTVSEDAAGPIGIVSGDRVILQGPDGRVELTARVEGGFEAAWLVTPATLGEIVSVPSTQALFLRVADDADVAATVTEVEKFAAGIEQGQIGGGAPVRAANLKALDTALVIVLALLAISVIISIVGIANTLSLSVIERTRESALLRALGMTRGQLRGMLGIEAILLALVGVVIGGLLGIGYAVAGVQSLFSEYVRVTPTLPWGQLVAIIVVAILAGFLASVLPARRAARVAPAQALAVE